ncbi:sugar transferase [Candidatus Contubernalis alkaliaceticus]|uniref:sugar transferase n=1 Tax=Candidatus Contubernalis alkaliaceticus TaxID=338645 RepID=UPI001F4C19B9|nr:sugar transferase [Candidatus Contubernalis alkalaceticus]UNC93465.1 sugar transferase [Candidatus Contubernalis alkalaceticus]
MGENTPKTMLNYLQMLGDILLLNGATLFIYYLRAHGEVLTVNLDIYGIYFSAVTLSGVLLFKFFGLYHTRNKLWSDIMSSLIVSIGLLTVLIIILDYMIVVYSLPRGTVLSSAVLQLGALGVWRWILLQWERKFSPKRKVLIIAPAGEAGLLEKKVKESFDRVQGIIVDSAEAAAERGLTVLGTYNDIEELCKRDKFSNILISGILPEEVKSKIARLSLKHNWKVFLVPNLYEIMIYHSRLNQLKDTPLLEISPAANNGKEQIKRGLDCIVAVIGLVITLPITLLTGLAIKLTSPGQVFFLQERVGRKGKLFMLYKFRTMVENAEGNTGPVLATENDPRITRVGKILRAARIDEIPQLINVLKGDMSIVGPRPERPVFVEQFEKEIPGYSYRHLMKAGITGLAQVAGNYSTSVEDKLRYDLLYTSGSSSVVDLKIMLQTIKVLMMKDKSL